MNFDSLLTSRSPRSATTPSQLVEALGDSDLISPHELTMAQYSSAAYKDDVPETRSLFDADTVQYISNPASGADLYIGKRVGNQCFIAFRGTKGIKDMLTDANAIRVKMDLDEVADSGRPSVHWGFLKQFRSIEPHLASFMVDVETIHITGHSLGGALATLCAMSLSHRHPGTFITLTTFGSPRVGCDDFAQQFKARNNIRARRYARPRDTVTTIPTSWRFKHVGTPIWMHNEGPSLSPKVGRFKRFFRALWRTITRLSVTDEHGMGVYKDYLKLHCSY